MNATGLARIECLSKDNYDTWKMQMEALLIKNDAWRYVSGECAKPALVANDEISRTAAKTWEDRDRKAKSDIILSMAPSELKQIKNCDTSRDVWLKLEGIYQSKGPARKATLLKRLTLHRMDEGDDAREHVRIFFDTLDKLGEMGIELNPDQLSIMLLYSLPPSFENFRCAIESRDELPAPETLRVKVIEESDARRNEMRSTASIPNAMTAGRSFVKSVNNKGRSDANNYSNKKEFKFRCHRCRRIGHKAADCHVRDGNDRSYAKSAEHVSVYASSEPVQTDEALRSESDARDARWCLDSGCTSHLCKDENAFVNITDTRSGRLNLASSACTNILAKGTASINTRINGKSKSVELCDTLHVPDLRTNLLSVGKITDRNYDVLFRKDGATVLDKNGNAVFTADRVNGLYYVRETDTSECRATSERTKETTRSSALNMWHRRLGHLNVKDIIEAQQKGVVSGMNIGKQDCNGMFECDICPRGKMTRTPFPKESERRSELLELIHSDVCGPMRTESNGKAKFFVTFIDDHTRWCVVKFLKKKNEAFEAFKEFKALAENRFGRKIKCLQSDNGTEYVNAEFNKFLTTHGIERRLTVPNNPEQNGVSERKNRTLVEMARCLLMQSELPASFWGEAVLTSNYIRNRCPTRSLNGKTPFELWTGKLPDVSHLRDFGCKVYSLRRKPNMGKFESRCQEGILLGYSEQSKAYRVWLPEKRQIEVTRDVKFVENAPQRRDHPGNYEDFVPQDRSSEDSSENQNNSGNETGIREIIIHTMPAGDAEDVEAETDEIDSEGDVEEDAPPGEALRRAPGRPRIERTGRRGRPKKLFHAAEARYADSEAAYNAEIPLKQAMRGPDADEWRRAVATELKSVIKNDTWELVRRPTDQDVIGSRVVLRNKFKADGTLEKRKARIVARGFSQRPGIDFNETFAPVARHSSIRLVTALAAQYGMKIHQFDVTTAYLNGTIQEKIYMEVPEMLEGILADIIDTTQREPDIHEKAKNMMNTLKKGDKVCLLKKALYGLKQAGRSWHTRLDEELRRLGASPTNADSCLYFKKQGGDLILIIVYVDDILVASRNTKEIDNFKRGLSKVFEMKDLEEVSCCLGMEFTRTDNEIIINQKGYIKDILERFGMQESKPVATPVDTSKKLSRDDTPPDEDEKRLPYRELVGGLMYLSVCTRPDISYITSYLSQFNTCYKKSHWIAAKRVLRYLKGTMDLGLVYKRNPEPLTGYVDADWGSCLHDRRSYTGYAFTLSSGAVSWDSKKQRTVALSSTEAEYMGLAEIAKEAIYLRGFLTELGLEELGEVTVFNDNVGAQKLVDNPVYHSRTKHIDVRHHFIREVVQNGQMKIKFAPSEEMPADILTKGVPGPKLQKCIDRLGLKIVAEKSIRKERSHVEG